MNSIDGALPINDPVEIHEQLQKVSLDEKTIKNASSTLLKLKSMGSHSFGDPSLRVGESADFSKKNLF